MIGTSYEIDFLFFPSHIVLLWLTNGLANKLSFRKRKICVIGLALAKLNFLINKIAVSRANFCFSCAHLWCTVDQRH